MQKASIDFFFMSHYKGSLSPAYTCTVEPHESLSLRCREIVPIDFHCTGVGRRQTTCDMGCKNSTEAVGIRSCKHASVEEEGVIDKLKTGVKKINALCLKTAEVVSLGFKPDKLCIFHSTLIRGFKVIKIAAIWARHPSIYSIHTWYLQ